MSKERLESHLREICAEIELLVQLHDPDEVDQDDDDQAFQFWHRLVDWFAERSASCLEAELLLAKVEHQLPRRNVFVGTRHASSFCRLILQVAEECRVDASAILNQFGWMTLQHSLNPCSAVAALRLEAFHRLYGEIRAWNSETISAAMSKEVWGLPNEAFGSDLFDDGIVGPFTQETWAKLIGGSARTIGRMRQYRPGNKNGQIYLYRSDLPPDIDARIKRNGIQK